MSTKHETIEAYSDYIAELRHQRGALLDASKAALQLINHLVQSGTIKHNAVSIALEDAIQEAEA